MLRHTGCAHALLVLRPRHQVIQEYLKERHLIFLMSWLAVPMVPPDC